MNDTPGNLVIVSAPYAIPERGCELIHRIALTALIILFSYVLLHRL